MPANQASGPGGSLRAAANRWQVSSTIVSDSGRMHGGASKLKPCRQGVESHNRLGKRPNCGMLAEVYVVPSSQEELPAGAFLAPDGLCSLAGVRSVAGRRGGSRTNPERQTRSGGGGAFGSRGESSRVATLEFGHWPAIAKPGGTRPPASGALRPNQPQLPPLSDARAVHRALWADRKRLP